MNPTTDQPLPPPPPPHLQPPPQPPQPHRPSTSCDLHPQETFTGFCPSCLCERLSRLDASSSSAAAAASSSRKPPSSSAAAALKAIFKPSNNNGNASNSNSKVSSFLPELRRTKSFSASKNEGFSGVFEPQRRSCDVRVRNTLWYLFSQDDERNISSASSSKRVLESTEVVVEPSRISTSSVRDPVFESKQEEEQEEPEEEDHCLDGSESGEIVCERVNGNNNNASLDFFNVNGLERCSGSGTNFSARNSNAKPIEEIIEEIEEEEEEEEEEDHIVIEPEPELVVGVEQEEEEEVVAKTMKDHINLYSQSKKPSGRDFKEIAGSFWSAASVFSKKLQKWRQKQKMKKRRNENGGPGSATLPVEKPISRQYRETQSEIADYGYGRRSCDTEPRFSLDAGRMSFDDPRYSFDEPRASWDGHLISRSTFPRMPTMLSVVEDAPVNVVTRSDAQILVEEPPRISMSSVNEDECIPGGCTQTKEYYSDSSSRRRRSLDRSSSIRKTAAAVVAEIDELKASVLNSKVSPATVENINGQKLDRDMRDTNSNSNSLRDDCSLESLYMGYRDNASIVGNGERKEVKKSRRWGKAWNILGFIHRRNGNKDEDEDRYSRVNGVERSFSESWPQFRGERNGDVRGGGFNPKIMRSNSSVSWRNSQNFGLFGNARKSNAIEANGNGNGRKKKDEFVLERNRSARYSPNNLDNGLLRFYLTPMRGSRRGGWGKSKPSHAHSITRSIMRLY